MTTAFLYAGQGSQKPGMGRDFYDEYPEVREIFDYTPDISPDIPPDSQKNALDLRKLCFDSDMAVLSQTEHTQPAMGAFAAAVTRLLAGSGVFPDYAAGLSLGEYGALHAAGAFDYKTLLDLLAFRGAAMAEASKGVDFKMSAVLCDSADIAERGVAETGGDVWCCNYNCPGQIVIGGERSAVEAAEALCLRLGARRCMPLRVGGPFHTPYMREASEKLAVRLKSAVMAPLKIPVVFNVTGGLVDSAASGDDTVSALLTRQIMSPVRFEESIKTLAGLSVGLIVEIGPGKVLSGFVRKTAPELTALNIETTEDYRRVLEQIKA